MCQLMRQDTMPSYVALGEDSHWSKNVFASCTDNGDQADVTNDDIHKDDDMHKDFFCETCSEQFLTKTLRHYCNFTEKHM